MKITLHLLPTLLLLGLLSCGSGNDKSSDENIVADTAQQLPSAGLGARSDSLSEITGLLQTSGLQPDEAKALGLKTGKYQLISQKAYFLEGRDDSLRAYLGQCITVTGSVAPEWKNNPAQRGEQTTYNRCLFVVDEVHPQLFSYCHFSDTTLRQPQGREVTYAGRVERMQRPAPDIAYDYQLRLLKPYRDANHPVQPGKLVQALPLVTADFGVLSALETALNQDSPLQIRGVQYQGYAESQAVWVQAADSTAL